MSNKGNRKPKQNIDVLSSNEENDDQDAEEEYEVETILDSRINPKTKAREYLVKWENYSEKQATWEPRDNLLNVMDIVQQYEKQQRGKSGKKSDIEDLEQVKDIKTQKKQDESKKVTEKKVDEKDGKRRQLAQKKKDDGEEKDSDDKEDYFSKEGESRGSKKRSIQQELKNVVEEIEEDEEEEQELVFVEIIDKRVTPQGTVEYLIHFQDVENQWVEESQLSSVSEEIKAFDAKREAEKAAAAKQKQSELDAQEMKHKKGPSKLTAKRTIPLEKPQTKQLSVEEITQVPAAQAQQTVIEQQQSQGSNKIVNKKSVLTSTTASTSDKQQPQLLTKRTEKAELGDFKTDNVDHVELQGEFIDVLSSRFEVFWKTRKDGVTPASSFFSSSYLKRYEPTVLIDYLINLNNAQLAKGSKGK